MAPDTHSRIELAREHFRQNRLAEAESQARAVLAVDPLSIPARLIVGAIFFRSGRAPEAESTLASILEQDPNHVDAIGLLAVIKRALGDPVGAAALFRQLVNLGQVSPDVYNQLGGCYLAAGDSTSAGAAFKKAIEQDRGRAHSYYNLGMALSQGGNSFETFETFKRAIELDPEFVDAYVQLWQQMRILLSWNEGLPILEDGLRRHPGSTQLMLMLASTYGKAGRTEEAEAMYKKAAQLDSAALPPYAHWLQEEGLFDASIPILQEAIRKQPLQGQAYYNLAVAKCFEVDGKRTMSGVPQLLRNPALPPEEKMFLYYALAKEDEDGKLYQRAMANYDAANELAYKLYNSRYEYDVEAVQAEHETLKLLYTKDMIHGLLALGSKSRLPLFIVGMIRTGTTLLDQILASHPQIDSAGEQPFWQISSGRVNRRWLESGPSDADIRDVESRYLQVLRAASKDAARVTDKMPTNFQHMGLMSVVFPHSKFIHMRRNPLDTCLSIYTTFLGRGTQFAYNQENIVNYYRAYMRTMEHWREVLPPGQMIEIDYEDLVSNKETVLRRVLSFCEIDWNEQLLSHETHRSKVSTPSLFTARQPVNAASVERWRKYEPWLGKLRALEKLTHPAAAEIN